MSIPYPFTDFGSVQFAAGFTSKYLHDKFGLDLGERFYRDLPYRIQTTMEIDRAVFEEYGDLHLGYQIPFPRISIEPFGHHFIPVMLGCECRYASDSEPWVTPHPLSEREIENLQPWTEDRFINSRPVQEIMQQTKLLQQQSQTGSLPENEPFNPHYRRFSSLQNLGSVINSAFSIQGESLFLLYLDRPDLVRKLYANITELMLLCLNYFPALDNKPLKHVFLGNCSVAMLSPSQYMDLNETFDRKIMEFSRSINAAFTLHQDSNVNANLENYSRFDYVQGLDFGQDTDFERAANYFPNAHANCILFPSWLANQNSAAIHSQIHRLLTAGKLFSSFSFSLYEIDESVAGDRLREFFAILKQCTQSAPHK